MFHGAIYWMDECFWNQQCPTNVDPLNSIARIKRMLNLSLNGYCEIGFLVKNGKE